MPKSKDKFAVIKIAGQQFRVAEGDEIEVNKIEGKPKADVLLLTDNDKVKIGKPTVKGAKVTLKVLDKEYKGKKLHVRTFKAKSRYRRKIGFRPHLTKLQIVKIA